MDHLRPEEYVAQAEVRHVELDPQGRKLTLRIYLLLLRGLEGSGRRAMALARKCFMCRAHPMAYDSEDPDPKRHVHSTLDVFKDVEGFSSSSWPPSERVWPSIMRMFKAGDAI